MYNIEEYRLYKVCRLIWYNDHMYTHMNINNINHRGTHTYNKMKCFNIFLNYI